MMRTANAKILPFKVDRSLPTALSQQIVHGVVSAVQNGYYGAGERLPSILELADDLEVGVQTVRRAVGELSANGEIVARPNRGIIVAEKRRAWFTRHVVHLQFSGPSYYFSAKAGQLEARLFDERIRVSPVMIHEDEFAAGLPHLKLVVDSQPVDLVLIDGGSGGLLPALEARDVPYLCPEEGLSSAADGRRFCCSRQPMFDAVAAHLTDCGVGSLAVIGRASAEADSLVAAMAARGIACSHWLPLSFDGGLEEGMERAGFELLQGIIDGGTTLPDALYFNDDYLARGGLTALLAAGVRVPMDVQVVAQVNVGHCPVFPVPLTRVELDPRRDADVLATLVGDAIRGRLPDAPVVLSAAFVPGETTHGHRFRR
jgi:DNA-binding transcriptional regulator YhcF (GntR family)